MVSSKLPVVPRGSILGPLLFIMYVNVLSTVFETAKVNLYVDNTAITVQNHDPQQIEYQLNQQLEIAGNWMNAKKPSLNIVKTKAIIFGSKTMVERCNNIQLKYQEYQIKILDKFKYLRIILDSQLTFKDHVKYIYSKVVPRLK